jgi:hypothetical protein
VFFSVTMSLDGFIAPKSLDELMMQQWMELQQWVFPQRFFRENLKLGEGGEEGRDNDDPAVPERGPGRRVLDRAVPRAVRLGSPPVRWRGSRPCGLGSGPRRALPKGDTPDLHRPGAIAVPNGAFPPRSAARGRPALAATDARTAFVARYEAAIELANLAQTELVTAATENVG